MSAMDVTMHEDEENGEDQESGGPDEQNLKGKNMNSWLVLSLKHQCQRVLLSFLQFPLGSSPHDVRRLRELIQFFPQSGWAPVHLCP